MRIPQRFIFRWKVPNFVPRFTKFGTSLFNIKTTDYESEKREKSNWWLVWHSIKDTTHAQHRASIALRGDLVFHHHGRYHEAEKEHLLGKRYSTGESKKLDINITPSNATYKNITIKSDDENIVKVDESNNIIAVNNGITKIIIKENYDNTIFEIPVLIGQDNLVLEKNTNF